MLKRVLFTFIIALTIALTNSQAQSGHWTLLTSGTSVSLLGVSAPSDKIIYACGASGVIRKTDSGGASWFGQTSGTTESLYSTCFTGINTGYAVGDNGAARRTIDGGTTWNPMTLPVSAQFRWVYFYDSLTGYITGGYSGGPGYILKTTNAGASWSLLPSSGATDCIYSIYFVDPLLGFANDYDGNILKTINGGTSWTVYSSGASGALNGGIFFTSATHGFVIGGNDINESTTSGTSWGISHTISGEYFLGIDFYDPMHGFVVGGNVSLNTGTILNTTDGGATWSSWSPAGCPRLYRVDFYDENLGFAVGLNGIIIKYINTIGINESEGVLANLNSYPNPFSTSTTIDCSNYLFDASPMVKMYDVTGKIVRDLTSTDKKQITIEKGDLNPGMYFYKVLDGNKMVGTGKMIIK